MKKMEECLRLNEEYQSCFQRTKARLEDHPEEKPFDFSEMYIFGKFNNFCRRYVAELSMRHSCSVVSRLQKLRELFETVSLYNCLNLSHIEGIEQLGSRFNVTFSTLKKKPYDVLEHRKTDFDSDYEDFKRQVTELDVSIHSIFLSPSLFTDFSLLYTVCVCC